MIKKFLIAVSFLITATVILCAQEIVTTRPQLKGVILEEYTGLNCPYCPQGHTIAEAILTANPDKVSVIAVHQGGFAEPNDGQPDFRTEFGNSLAGQTSLEGYPSGTINRHFFSDLSTSGGTALNRGDWEAAAEEIMTQESYVNLGISSEFDEGTRELTVTVEAYYTGNLPFGVSSNFIQVALIESNIIAYQAGASASYNHKHMLRYLITGQWGDEVTGVEYGSLVTRTYVYTVPEEWVAANCEIVAFVTESHQEVITGNHVALIGGANNGEVTADYARMFVNSSPISVGQPSVNSEFICKIINGLASGQNFNLSLTHDAPADWDVSFIYDGNTYTDIAALNLTADAIVDVQIIVVPGATPGVAKCLLTLSSTDFPANDEKVVEVFAISGVQNLIVNGSGSGSGISSYSYESYYKNALLAAGCETIGSIPGYTFEQAVDLGALEEIHNLYFNIGGTTPVLSLGQVIALRGFIDNGGNLFLAGQDIGRDIMGIGSTSGSITHKTFFQNYLGAIYLNDGDATNNSITAENADSVFGFIPTSALIDIYDGAFDPDGIKKSATSFQIFSYPNTKAGGLRAYKGSARIVLLAFGLEQVSNEETRNDIMDRTYRWFEGWEGTGVESSIASDIKISPNPASEFINVSGVDGDFNIYIFDIAGKMIISSKTNTVNIEGISKGIYFVKITGDGYELNTKFVKE